MCVGALRHVQFEIFDVLIGIGNFFDQPAQVGTDAILRFGVLGAQPVQAHDFGVHGRLFNHERIARRNGLHFGIRQRPRINVFDVPDVRVAGHHLMDEFRFGFQRLPHIGIKTAFGDVAINLDCLVLIALPQNPAFALFHVGRTPRRIQMMQGNQSFLNIRASAHFLRAAHEDANFAGTHLLEQSMFLQIAVEILHEGDLLGGNAACNELGFQIIVGAKLAAQF